MNCSIAFRDLSGSEQIPLQPSVTAAGCTVADVSWIAVAKLSPLFNRIPTDRPIPPMANAATGSNKKRLLSSSSSPNRGTGTVLEAGPDDEASDLVTATNKGSNGLSTLLDFSLAASSSSVPSEGGSGDVGVDDRRVGLWERSGDRLTQNDSTQTTLNSNKA